MLNDVQTISSNQYITLIDYTVGHGINLIVFGPSGSGKTMTIISRCILAGIPYVYLNISVLEAPDMIGLPTIREKMDKFLRETRKVTSYAMPEKFDQEKPFILIVDELDKGKEDIQNPLLELFQFRSINGVKVNIKAIIATGNLPDEGAFSGLVNKALANRCLVTRLEPDFNTWRDGYALQNNINPLIIGFLDKNPHFFSKINNEETGYVSPTPRSWTFASEDISRLKDKQDISMIKLLIAGRVGKEAMLKFSVWYDYYLELEPLMNLLVKEGKHPGNLSQDKLFVCAVSSVAMATHEKDVSKAITNVFGWLNTVPTEIQICAAKSSISIDIINKHNLMRIPIFLEVFRKLKDIIK